MSSNLKEDRTDISVASLFSTKILAEATVLIALSGALHLIPFYQAPSVMSEQS